MRIYLLYLYIYILNVFINLYYYFIINAGEKTCEIIIDLLNIIHSPIFYMKENNIIISNGYESDSEGMDSDDSDYFDGIELYKKIKKEMSINTLRMNKGKYKCNSTRIKNCKYKKYKLKCGFTFDMEKNSEVALRQNIKNKLILLSYILPCIKVSDVISCLDKTRKQGRYLFLFVEDGNSYNENIIVDLELKKNVITCEDLYFSTITC